MSTNPAPRVLVVGSGIAGLTAALGAAGHGLDVTLLSKDALDETGTARAQGGIAAMTAALPAGQPRDSEELHVQDTLAAGAGTCDDDAVRVLVRDSAAAIDELVARGVALDRAAGPDSPWLEGLEGAHSVPRILHAGGDATGREIQRALLAAALAAEAAGRLTVLRHTMLVDLVLGPGGRAAGALVLAGPGDRLHELAADAVVLATGGAGQLYPHTTNPAVATGDGIVAALRAGAAVADLEFVQFHPTALAAPGCFLVSEAVRGEGAVLRDSTGRRYLEDVHPRAELAPRDVVARENVRRSLAQDGLPVLLDCTALSPSGPGPHGGGTTAEFLARRFPTIDAALRAHGLDWSREPVPVTPAAHYLMGGVATDGLGRTTVPGLYAVGECAATGVHGANRLASNSLLEGAVFGARVAEALQADALRTDAPGTCRAADDAPVRLVLPGRTEILPAAGRSGTAAARSRSTAPFDRDAVPFDKDTDPVDGEAAQVDGDTVPFDRGQFQDAMWAGAGVLRDRSRLEALARRLAGFRPPAGLSRRAVEDRNLLTVGRAVTAAALHRTESRGAHFREDFPAPDPARARRTFWRLEPAPDGVVEAALTCAHTSIDMFDPPERIPAC
ncbi:L-aspartate oxidase [Kocuria rosea]|uniref:L-aspartate oxidase n=1 Tax=Kocuria rosea subsp. polaris TaxID=136273 RepID=A0A0A6VUS2_KOCRO|nr:FAD-dependent oxidoreductase [Kocuria polaris]KHD98306.1 L-aspartate oxidase [Kocuria polaris]